MNKSNLISSIAILSLILGGVSHFHEKYIYNESLKGPYGLGKFLFLVGVLMVVYLIWKKRSEGKN